MKNIPTLVLLASLIISRGFSQNFPMDARGEIVYQEVVEVDSLKKEAAYRNGLKWFASLKHEQVILTTKDSLAGNLSGHSAFLVYDQSGVFKKQSGKITYLLSLNVKDGKYRYTFSDFVFHYYKQDRYYKLVETGKTKNLKEREAKGWQKLWNKHRISTSEEMIENINSLKTTMKEVPMPPVDKAKVRKVEW